MTEVEIDMVYLWVDGSDPEWIRKRNAAIGITEEDSAVNCEGRYADNEELKYSLRSLEKYAPWIRRIFIVTDGQTPKWLDTSNGKIRIVDHREILPADCLPTFNSVVIEHALHKIPGLSEHFLYGNDDMFFNRAVKPADFFTPDGRPIARLNRRPMRRLTLWIEQNLLGKTLSNYNRTILNAAEAVKHKYGRFIGSKTHHNIDAYCKSLYSHTFETFRGEIEPTLRNKVRSDNDIQRNLYTYLPITERKCTVKYVSRRTSFRLHIERRDHYGKLDKRNPMLFCVNDSQYASTDDRKYCAEYLQTRFPEKSAFEK